MKSRRSVYLYVPKINEMKMKITLTHVLKLKEKENNYFKLPARHLFFNVKALKNGIL